MNVETTKQTTDSPEKNDCRYLDRYFGNVCRNEATHPPFAWIDDLWCHIEPRCEKKPGCGYEKTTPFTKAWDAVIEEKRYNDANHEDYPRDCSTCKFKNEWGYPSCTYDYWEMNGMSSSAYVCWNTCLGRFYEKKDD